MPDYMQEFDDDFEFKDLPDESTPHNAENMGRALKNTRLLKRFINDVITGNVDLVVKSVYSKNLFDYSKASDANNTIITSAYRLFKIDKLKPNTTYTLSGYTIDGPTSGFIYLWDTTDFSTSKRTLISNPTTKPATNFKNYTSNIDGIIYLAIANNTTEIWNENIKYFEKAQLEEGKVATEYGPHQF